MKAAPFEYVCPKTLDEAIAALSQPGIEAKLIAGGQSLMPVMNFRLATPDIIIDLRKIEGLSDITIDADGVRLGSKVRWCDIEADKRLTVAHPLLSSAITHVAHYQVRNRGTVGGSLAHADNAAELPGVAVTCDAEIKVVGPRGRRTIAAADFFLGPLTTCLEPDEIIIELHFPPWPETRRSAFMEFSRRRGDFALSGIALFMDRDADGRLCNTHVGVVGASDRPMRMPAVEAALNGATPNENEIVVARDTLGQALEPPEDLHAGAAYRRALSMTLFERSLRQALA